MSLIDVLRPADPPPAKRARTVRPMGWDDVPNRPRAVAQKRRGRRLGEAHHRAKLNDAAVARARELRAKNPALWTLPALADLFKVPLSTVRDWVNRSVRSK